MEIDQSKIQALIDRPSESLAVEIKNWIKLDDPHGKSKIIRAALALRNHGGGYLLIGFNDNTLQPETEGVPPDVRDAYHSDKVQMAIGKYASSPFEVGVAFGKRGAQEFPVLVIPPGVQSPVAAKADMLGDDGKKLITTDDVYVRTLRSTVPATAKAGWMDWAPLIQVCLDNREADIGRFLRRHLVGNLDGLKGLLSELSIARDEDAAKDKALKLLDLAASRMEEISGEQSVSLPEFGYWDVALVIDPAVDGYEADSAFLRLLDGANPSLTGWPLWLVSYGFQDTREQPFVNDDAWETFIGRGRHVQYMRFDPKGTFVQRSILVDDMSRPEVEPGKFLDFAFPIQDCAEAIVVGLEFAKALGSVVKSEDQPVPSLHFAFRWSGLNGREISHWGHPRQYIVGHRGLAYQDVVTASVVVPVDVPLPSIGSILLPAIRRLYSVFGGFKLGDAKIEEIALRTVNRQQV